MVALRSMLHLELPHINVLSKIDLMHSFGDLRIKSINYYLISLFISDGFRILY